MLSFPYRSSLLILLAVSCRSTLASLPRPDQDPNYPAHIRLDADGNPIISDRAEGYYDYTTEEGVYNLGESLLGFDKVAYGQALARQQAHARRLSQMQQQQQQQQEGPSESYAGPARITQGTSKQGGRPPPQQGAARRPAMQGARVPPQGGRRGRGRGESGQGYHYPSPQ